MGGDSVYLVGKPNTLYQSKQTAYSKIPNQEQDGKKFKTTITLEVQNISRGEVGWVMGEIGEGD